MNFKILHITGARPHFMKLAPVYKCAAANESLAQVIVHTGQHYDDVLYRRFLDEFNLPMPQYDLQVGSAGHAVQIGKILIELDGILQQVKPDIVFVYGDTNSTAAGAIAAAKSNIPVAHVEAGLREFDKRIPEEVNKLLVDAVSDIYFCPTESAVANLGNAGVTEGVYHVGDVVVDLIYEAAGRSERHDGNYILVTCHRASNTDDPIRLKQILEALRSADRRVIFPIHPRTAKAVDRAGFQQILKSENIDVISPCGFWEMQKLIRSSTMVLTDSGGVIREAYVHKRPCVILDDQTEWVESVEEGWSRIAGADTESILTAIDELKGFDGPQSGFLGDGNAAQRVIKHTLEYLGKKTAI